MASPFICSPTPTTRSSSQYGSLGGFNGMVIANRNTFLIDPQGNIAKVWVKVVSDQRRVGVFWPRFR